MIDVQKILEEYRKKKSVYWEKVKRHEIISLVQKMAIHVPAYKQYLKEKHITVQSLYTKDGITSFPSFTKKNYLRKYPFKTLSWNGSLAHPLVFTATSGSTGEPFYFPRSHQLDAQYAVIANLFLDQGKKGVKNETTLVIIGFGMGVWIGGLITYQAFEIAARTKDLPVSIITPGINKTEILKALRKLSPLYDQTILVGYPPFVKDVVDAATEEGINIKKLHLRFMFAAEVFSEELRDYFAKKTQMKNIYLDTLSVYGTADIGAMAWETGISVLIKRLMKKDKELFHAMIPETHKMPTFAQYDPRFVQFESVNGELLVTGNNTIPFARYALGDNGGVLSFEDVKRLLLEHGYDIHKEAQKMGIKNWLYQLPFVYVYERSDFSTTLYGLQIYPETIREAIITSPAGDFMSGKFAMLTKFTSRQDQYLEINVELKKGKTIPKRMQQVLSESIFHHLKQKSSEFTELSRYLGDRAQPTLVFWPSEHPQYFRPGVKQRWVV